MAYALSPTRIAARPPVAMLSRSSYCFHTHSTHLRLLRNTSFSNFCDSFRYCGFGRLIAIRKVGSRSQSSYNRSRGNSDWDLKSPPPLPFDICNVKNVSHKSLTEPLSDKPAGLRFLKPGMVLLKRFLAPEEQISIVRECRGLGVGPGGFYWPNMRLMLMCLGLDWDPHTRKYNKTRRFDKAWAPDIPNEFVSTVKRAVNAAQALTAEKHRGAGNVEDVLPTLSPDICIVNFYTTLGRLGLHQDRDESRASLAKGLPIVSFSVGDSAEFLYGDDRDIYKSKKVVLESGDVVIFGGPSRHIFHGVQSIIPRTSPQFLLNETGLLPGRLNLTFRQY